MHVVLVEPEIPPNTGNIARTCAITNTTLHLVKPLGFDISDKYVKRAGLDYWHFVDIQVHDSWDDFYAKYHQERLFFATTKASQAYSDVKYQANDFLVFGKETKGLPEPLLHAHWDQCITIPMLPQVRSLNLSNSVAIILYEAYRQLDFNF